MTADLDVIIVHYHAAAQVRDAVSALRHDAESTALSLQIIVADNGSTSEERALLQSLPIRYFDTGRNAGYAGAANAAFPETSADCIVLMNEDVLVLPGCLGRLREALIAGASVAGPAFFWDTERTFMLPCTEERTRQSEVTRAGAGASVTKLQRARRGWREHARRHWRATTALPTASLSGALLAFRRDTWNIIGPMDDRYHLYFEEDDWLCRITRAKLTSLYVPQATAIHLHNPGLAQSPARLAYQAESFLRFGNHYYGETFMRRLSLLSARGSIQTPWPRLEPSDFPIGFGSLSQSDVWIELTPSPLGFPAAATRVTGGSLTSWTLPPLRGLEFLEGPLYLQVVDDQGEELGGYRLERWRNRNPL
ncbi:MAG TPA: glycosyltransferase [Thermoanaerobaculia bacterium]